MERKFFLGQFLIWVILLLGQLHGYRSCIVKERKAMLELKKYLISRTQESYLDYVLPTWTNDTKSDCCLWDGIKCNLTSRRAINIDIGVSGGAPYPGIKLLNLSLLHSFEELRSLNLSGGRDYNSFSFEGFFDDVEGYKSLRKLKYLEILDLSSNAFNNSIFPFLNAVTSLTTLNLRNNFVENLSIKELKNLTNLESLDLSSNYLNGSIRELTHLKNLKALDLSTSNFASSIVLQDLKNLTNLEALGLAGNSLDGPIPIEVCEMKNLRELNLKQNRFVGQLPLCLGSLNKLWVLDLSSNQFSGSLPSSFSSLESLEYLSLLDNNFTSLFSLNPLTNLTKLKVLKLSSTSHKVQVETEGTWHPKFFQLSVAILRFCNLKKIPSFLMYQKNLHLVDLSNNRLSGDIPTWLLANNSELKVLQLQKNSFTFFQMPTRVHNLQVLDISANHISGVFPTNIGRALPNLVEMNGSHNGFQGQLPSSLCEMKNISLLDLSYNNFSKKLPRSFLTGCLSLKYLWLSHNKFTGHCLPRGTSFTSLEYLRIDNNLFRGKIEVCLLNSTSLSFLDMSNNCLTGAIPSWVSMFSGLHALSLSNNFLEGTIPPSLVDLRLEYLDLSGNLLSGALPSYMGVSFLFLQNNSFTGPIPNTLVEGVTILSLGNNKLSGSIPQFVNTDLDISILLLRGNNLTGSIPRQLCDFRDIDVLDLSNNKLNGFVPSCLFNLSFGVREDDVQILYGMGTDLKRFKLDVYKFTFVVEELVVEDETFKEIGINFASKKRFELYTGERSLESEGILGYMYGMDLSNNELSGVIPAELGDLGQVKALNLSHNFLSSSIPSTFSNLTAIESLDLSYNMLHGSIPYQLTDLTFLEVFDVSHNNLSGIIPQGKQFNTFNASSYLGNPLLCGPAINISCETENRSEEVNYGGAEEEENEAAIDMLVFYYSMASVYVTV